MWDLNNARHLFDKMSKRNVVSWTAMIFGYSHNGYATKALSLFDEMQVVDVIHERVWSPIFPFEGAVSAHADKALPTDKIGDDKGIYHFVCCFLDCMPHLH
jgi:pentatricopeptide repeat protein